MKPILTGWRSRAVLLQTLFALSLGLGCGKGAASLEIVSGDGQSAQVGTALSAPLVVRAKDESGAPMAGMTIQFANDTEGGSFVGLVFNTNTDGVAQAGAVLGKKAGPQKITATSGSTTATFSASASAGPLAKLVKLGGDSQEGVAASPLGDALRIGAVDAFDNPLSGIPITWGVVEGGGSIKAMSDRTGEDGALSAQATLGPALLQNRFSAASQGIQQEVFTARRKAFRLVYSDPPAKGKLRLIRNSSSTAQKVVLDLVVAQGTTLTGYAAGFNLPLAPGMVDLDPMEGMTPGKALDPGSAPVAAKAVLPKSGPLSHVLVAAQSQKASGTGAVTKDAVLPEGTVIFTVRLVLSQEGPSGVVFDGGAANFKLRSAGMRSLIGTSVVDAGDVAIGKLEVQK